MSLKDHSFAVCIKPANKTRVITLDIINARRYYFL